MTTGQITTLPVPSGHGSLDQYIHTVNSIPLLTPEEEHNLAERKMGGDVEAAKQLILRTSASLYPSPAATTATASTKPT